MTLEFTAAEETLLKQIAADEGRTPEAVLLEAARSLSAGWAEDDAEEQTIMDERVAEADAGVNWISNEEMGERVKAMLQRR